MTFKEHDTAARALRRLAGKLENFSLGMARLPQVGSSDARDCLARAKDQIQVARDHVEREALAHEREARKPVATSAHVGETRVYPAACTSAFCGRGTCPEDCRSLPARQEFERWRDARGAVKGDPIWCPTVWTATR